MELIKNTIKLGNSAGVLLPREWLGNRVKVTIEPLHPEKEIIDILNEANLLPEIMGLYLVGSYAREEQTLESDVDILAITFNLNKKIKTGPYEIICVSKQELENQLNENALPILPMLLESKAIINKELIKKYLSTKINYKNLKYHLETTKSALKIIKEDLDFSKKSKENASDASAYSLVLRLRTFYIIECLKKGKRWSKKEFLALIEKISGSTIAYERYLSSKNENTACNKIPIEQAEELMQYLNTELGELEKWLREKKD